MKKIVLFSPKGGTGKTTLSLNLAGSLAARGQRVLVLDRDPNKASLLWSQLAERADRELTFAVAGAVPQRDLQRYDVVILDLAPGAEAPPADLIVIPTLLDAASVISAQAARQTLTSPSVIVPNRVRFDRADDRRTLTTRLASSPYVTDRALLAGTAYGRGVTVYDERAGLLHAHAARREIDTVRCAIEAAMQPRAHAA